MDSGYELALVHVLIWTPCIHVVRLDPGININLIYHYRPQMKLWEGNMFTPVCQLFCSQGDGVSMTETPPGQRPPWT